jgi:integrase
MASETSSETFDGRSFPFTEKRIAAAREAADLKGADTHGRRTWRDEGCAGLTLVVNVNTGSAVYYFQAKVNGQTTRRALGPVEVVSLVEARAAVNRLRFDRTTAGVLVPRPVEAGEPEDAPRVGEVVEAMLQAHAAGKWLPGTRTKAPSARTVKFYADLRRAQLKQHEGLTLAEYAERFSGIFDTLRAEAPYQANRLVQLVRNLYAYAAKFGMWSGQNPAIGNGAERLTRAPEEARTRTLTDAEWRRLDAAMKDDMRVWRDAFTTSILTLQRMGAVCHMKWRDLLLTGQDASWKIPKEFMKGQKSGHVVPLAQLPELLAILKERRKLVPKSCEWVFPAVEGDGGFLRNYDKAWKRILVRAKLDSEDKDERPRPHDLRRTGGERMTTGGVPIQTVTRALGNSPKSVGMVARVYAQVADSALRDAFAAANAKSPRRSKR